MANKLGYLANISLAILLISSISFATSTRSSITSFLGTYNVSSATVNSMSIVNLTLGSHSYAALYSSTSLFLLVNVSSPDYKIVTNQSSIADVILNRTLVQSYGEANLSIIVADMHAYQESSISVLNACYESTGLFSGLSCTSSTNCAACNVVPTCGGYVVGLGSLAADYGADAAYGAVARFGANMSVLNNSYASFYYAASTINQSNLAAKLAEMKSAYDNISAASTGMQANPLFTLSLTSSQLSECIATTGYPSQPSYCTFFSYCGTLSFNASALTSVGGLLGEVSSIPLSYSQVYSLAYPASANGERYVSPVITSQKTAQLKEILNTTLKNYTVMVNSTNVLLGHYYNLSLAAQLSALESNYNNLTSSYISENLTEQQSQFASQIEKFNAIYGVINARYENLTSEATNNTVLLIGAQLNSNSRDPQLASYALEQMQLNSLVSAKVSDYASLKSQLDQVNAYVKANYNPPFSLGPLAVAIYAPFSRLLASSLGDSYAPSVAFAPSAGAILTLIVGIIIIILVALYYNGLRKRNKLRSGRHTGRNWIIVFIVLLVIVLLLAYATMAYLSSANTSLSSFQSSVRGAGTIAIVSNGTNAQLASCAQQLATKLAGMGKKVSQYSISANICTSASSSGTVDSCLNSLAVSNMPTVILSISQNNSISLSSLYGTSMDVQGSGSFMAQCYASQLI